MAARRGSRARRICAYLAGIAVLVGGIGWLIGRDLWSVRIIPASPARLSAIVGEDLEWTPKPTAKPGITFAEVERLTGAAKLKIPPFNSKTTDAEILKLAPQIEGTRKSTDILERIIATRDASPAQIMALGEMPEVGLFSLRTAYERQFVLAMVRRDSARALELILREQEFERFQASRQGGFLDYGIPSVSRMVGLAWRRNAFSTAQLRRLYDGLDVAPAVDRRVPRRLAFCFQQFVAEGVEEEAKQLHSPPPGSSEQSSVGEFDIAKTYQAGAAITREGIHNASLPWHDMKWPIAEAVDRIFRALPKEPTDDDATPGWRKWFDETLYRQKMRGIPNVIGLETLRGDHDGYGAITQGTLETSTSTRTLSEAGRLLVSLWLYEKTFGHYPAKLTDLRVLKLPGPEPVDFFAGGPFHYDARRLLLWSVGENGVDDGGRTDLGSGPADDLLFKHP